MGLVSHPAGKYQLHKGLTDEIHASTVALGVGFVIGMLLKRR